MICFNIKTVNQYSYIFIYLKYYACTIKYYACTIKDTFLQACNFIIKNTFSQKIPISKGLTFSMQLVYYYQYSGINTSGFLLHNFSKKNSKYFVDSICIIIYVASYKYLNSLSYS